jgi:VanZ family protein
MNLRKIRISPNWFWPIVVTLTVLALTVVRMPSSQLSAIPHIDKAGHLLYLGLIATLFVRFLKPWTVIAIGTAMSVGIEAVQFFLPWRECSAVDAIFGIVGTILAVLLYRYVRPYRNLIEFRFRSESRYR